MKLIQIIEVNNVLRQGLEKGLAINNLMENWDFLQIQCAMYINSELPGLSAQYQGPGKPCGVRAEAQGQAGSFLETYPVSASTLAAARSSRPIPTCASTRSGCRCTSRR